MDFFNSAITVLQTLVIALGADLGIWGTINLLEGYGNDNPGAKSPLKGLRASLGRRHKAADGRRRCRPHRYHPGASAFRPLLLKDAAKRSGGPFCRRLIRE